MRNENLELAQSSGSDSSPSWGLDSNSARVSNFTFDLGPTKTIDDLTTRFTVSNPNLMEDYAVFFDVNCITLIHFHEHVGWMINFSQH